jgi:hypothetical protein
MGEFIVEQAGPSGLFCVFEDDGETGYLYLYQPDDRGVIKHLQIYDSSKRLMVDERDVEVIWSADGKKCGVVIWDGIRGIIDLDRNKEGRAKLESRETPPITDPEWLKGLDLDPKARPLSS